MLYPHCISAELLKKLDNQRILSQLQRSVNDLESQNEVQLLPIQIHITGSFIFLYTYRQQQIIFLLEN